MITMCSIYKWILSTTVSENKEPSGFTGRHITKCDSCRQYYTDHVKIAQQLSSGVVSRSHLSHSRGKVYKRSYFATPARVAAMIAIATTAIFAYIKLTQPSQQHLNSFDQNAQLLVDAPVIQYATLLSSASSEEMNNQYTGIEALAKETFILIYDSFNAATDIPGMNSETN